MWRNICHAEITFLRAEFLGIQRTTSSPYPKGAIFGMTERQAFSWLKMYWGSKLFYIATWLSLKKELHVVNTTYGSSTT